MSLFRFFSIIFFLGLFSISGNLLAAPNSSDSKSNQNGNPSYYQVPDNPDMPSGDPNGPDTNPSFFQVPDNPDMPSGDPNGPDTNPSYFQVPDNPDMPSGDPNGPDGRDQRANRSNSQSMPSPASMWDKAFGWLKSLLDIS